MGFGYYDNKIIKRKGLYKNTTKEERAKALDNIICHKCGYQNARYYAKKYGKCKLCGSTIDKDFFIRELEKRLIILNKGGNKE